VESNNSTISRYDNLFGCFQTGLGGIQRTRGCWSERESQDHINILELRAAFFALKSFLPSQTNRVFCLKMDNTTAVAYLHNMGGTHCHKLLHLALEVWKWCEKRNIFLLPQHIQDKCQGRSRVAGETRFERLENTFKGTSAFNQALHSGMDLFASRITHQLNMN
jgi:hypothetical protein